MIDKLIIDDAKIELTDADKLPYTYVFSTAKTHTVKYGLSDTDEISASAFANCANMVSVKFPKEITSIKRNAFENCVRLDNVVIPTTIKYIGANAWKGCTGMTQMTFESDVPPTSYAEIPAKCKVYIPNESKYEPIAYDNMMPDSEQYYTKTEYNMYKEIPARLITSTGEYYRDKWTSIAPNAQTVEEKNKIEITGLDFLDINGQVVTGTTTTKVGERLTVYYRITPADATNRNIHVYNDYDATKGTYLQSETKSLTILDDSVEGEIICYANAQGNTDLRIYSESGETAKLTFSVTR